jgi:hypothetical protein
MPRGGSYLAGIDVTSLKIEKGNALGAPEDRASFGTVH